MTREPIETITTTAINWWEMGHHFAEQVSDDQALFLHGVAIGFSEFGARDLQYEYIAENIRGDFNDDQRAEVREWMQGIINRI